MQKHQLVRCVAVLSAAGIPTVSGCAHVTQRGGAEVYTNGPSIYYLIIAVGLGFIGFGIYAIWLGAIEQTERGKAQFRKECIKKYGHTKPHPAVWKSALCVLLGGMLITVGLGISTHLSAKSQVDRVEVFDDRFIIRKAKMLDDGQDRIFQYANIQSIVHDAPLIRTKRSKEYYIVNLNNGGSHSFKVAALERAAFPKIVEKLDLFRSKNPTPLADVRPDTPPAVAKPQEDVATAARPADRSPASRLHNAPTPRKTQIESMRAGQAGQQQPSTGQNAAMARLEALQAKASARRAARAEADAQRPSDVRRRPITIALPDGASVVQDETPLIPGTRLGAVWADKWNYVTVMEVNEDGTVKVKWDGWNSVYDMVREDLAVTADVLAELEYRSQLEQPRERLWTDVSGKFQVTATYVDSKSGKVRLKKLDGTEVTVPLQKLSREDRRLVTQLARKQRRGK